jgi:hypothetical protein
MRVAICYTKLSPEGILNCDAFAEGILNSGDTVCPILGMSEIGRLAKWMLQAVLRLNPHGGLRAGFRRIREGTARRRS